MSFDSVFSFRQLVSIEFYLEQFSWLFVYFTKDFRIQVELDLSNELPSNYFGT